MLFFTSVFYDNYGSYWPRLKPAFFKCSITVRLFYEGCPFGRYNVPLYGFITKIDLKKGLYGIYPDLKFNNQAISERSLNNAACPFFYWILALTQFTF